MNTLELLDQHRTHDCNRAACRLAVGGEPRRAHPRHRDECYFLPPAAHGVWPFTVLRARFHAQTGTGTVATEAAPPGL